MTSRRARSARHLSTVLTNESGVWVRVTYLMQRQVYGVLWTGGPDAAAMYNLAAAHVKEIPQLDLDALVWLRTEPTPNPYGRP